MTGIKWAKKYGRCQEIGKKRNTKDNQKILVLGDGTKVGTEGTVKIPVIVNGEEIFIKAYMIKSEIPLIISSNGMKNLGVMLDLMEDKMQI